MLCACMMNFFDVYRRRKKEQEIIFVASDSTKFSTVGVTRKGQDISNTQKCGRCRHSCRLSHLPETSWRPCASAESALSLGILLDRKSSLRSELSSTHNRKQPMLLACMSAVRLPSTRDKGD